MQLAFLNTALPASVGAAADWLSAGSGRANDIKASSAAAANEGLYIIIEFSCPGNSGGFGHGPNPPAQLTSEGEHVERRPRLHLLQLRRGIDEPLVPGAAHPDQDRDVLLAIDAEGHRRRIDATAGVELPLLLQRLAVERQDFSRRLSGEHQIG